ncbi:MAG TPA: prolipoprotein diacylglyceryl transferase [Candidatus Nanoarchaeia archaeon]|nr:prolipoprotein diacylglyceryl transferase [Candidatus Nanoarchaeia archaeon]
MFVHNFDPVLANIGPLEIRYYGLMYVLGFILGYFMIQSLAKKKVQIKKSSIEDLLVYTGIFGILGARLFYILFYNLSYYVQNPYELIAIWHGGLSFHGGLLGGAFGIYVFSRQNKFNFFDLLDLVVVPFSFALGLGRIGNFINGELPGRLTSVPWCFEFPGIDGCRHPSQLYESLYSFVIFGILWKLKDKRMKSGMLFGIFMLLYSSFRFFTEFFREADVQLGYFHGLTMGQLLNILLFIAGLVFIKHINKSKGR